MKRLLACLIVVSLTSLCSGIASAQFRSDAFTQQYNDDKNKNGKDSVDVLFSLPEFFGGLRHERTARIGTMFAGSTVLIGAQQIYNNQTWKLPIIYGTIGGGVASGIYFNSTGNSDVAKYCFIGAGLAYWGTLLDGALNYKPSPYPYAGRATIMSILCPGLGQAYNKEYWKIPIYVGGLIAAVHYYDQFNTNFQRFRNIYIEATDPEVKYTGPVSAETALYYRNLYRSWKDYAIIAIAAVYLLQVFDANVFAYMHDFEVNDNISLDVAPTVIMPEKQVAATGPAVGLSFGLRF